MFLRSMNYGLQLPAQAEKWAKHAWLECEEADIMITIRLVSHPNFPATSFKARLSATKKHLVECFCCKNPGLRSDKVNLIHVLDKETRATQMMRRLQRSQSISL